MAKKKGNKASNNASVDSMPRASDDASSQGTQPAAAAAEQQEQQVPVDQLSVEQLRSELAAARAELARLRVQTTEPLSTAGKLHKPQEVQELHSKLQKLRAEQAEADAARDKAWTQLKVRSRGWVWRNLCCQPGLWHVCCWHCLADVHGVENELLDFQATVVPQGSCQTDAACCCRLRRPW